MTGAGAGGVGGTGQVVNLRSFFSVSFSKHLLCFFTTRVSCCLNFEINLFFSMSLRHLQFKVTSNMYMLFGFKPIFCLLINFKPESQESVNGYNCLS